MEGVDRCSCPLAESAVKACQVRTGRLALRCRSGDLDERRLNERYVARSVRLGVSNGFFNDLHPRGPFSSFVALKAEISVAVRRLGGRQRGVKGDWSAADVVKPEARIGVPIGSYRPQPDSAI